MIPYWYNSTLWCLHCRQNEMSIFCLFSTSFTVFHHVSSFVFTKNTFCNYSAFYRTINLKWLNRYSLMYMNLLSTFVNNRIVLLSRRFLCIIGFTSLWVEILDVGNELLVTNGVNNVSQNKDPESVNNISQNKDPESINNISQNKDPESVNNISQNKDRESVNSISQNNDPESVNSISQNNDPEHV